MDLNKQNSDQADLIAKKAATAEQISKFGYIKNPKTGLNDYMLGDHSLKRWFKQMAIDNQWFWIFLVFATVFVLQVINFGTVIDWVADGFADSVPAGIMVTMGMVIVPLGAFLVGYAMLYRWWKYLTGEMPSSKLST